MEFKNENNNSEDYLKRELVGLSPFMKLSYLKVPDDWLSTEPRTSARLYKLRRGTPENLSEIPEEAFY